MTPHGLLLILLLLQGGRGDEDLNSTHPRNTEELCGLKGPQIFFSQNCGEDLSNTRVTGQEIQVNPHESQGYVLQCLEAGDDPEVNLKWTLQSERKPSRTLILNYLALISWKRTVSPRACNTVPHSPIPPLHTKCRSASAGPLEIFVVPETSTVTSTFTCSNGKGQEGSVTVKTLPVTQKIAEKEENKEFLELINILMQILQSSGSSGEAGGSGPLYGVGFGSTTIIVLMAIAIYYLKRQVKQLQEEVETVDRRRRKSRPSQIPQDEEDDL